MYYYDVWVRSNRYRGKRALSYSHASPLQPGTITRVQLQKELVSGVIVSACKKPRGLAVKSIDQVTELPTIPPELIQTARWLQAYYRASIGSIAQTIVPAAIPQKLPSLEIPAPSHSEPDLPALNDEQAVAVAHITEPGGYILHGKTGSGKTRVYQELSKQQLADGKSVLILSPEIGLTSQLANNFMGFGRNRVVVLHSAMTAAERLRLWRRIAGATEPLIIIGARSALFSPVKRLGLVVVDEFHEPAYKQEQEPRYHAVRAAAVLAQAHKAAVVFGSATPPIVDYAAAEQKKRPIIRLQQQAVESDHTLAVQVVDLKASEHFSKSPYLSDQLIQSIAQSLAAHEQSLLYLNRRGTARVSLCNNCGWQAACPHCDLPLTYHGDEHHMRCHVCNFHSRPLTTCPECSNSDITFRSAGTKAIITDVQRLFPDAKLMRFDSDNTKLERLEHHYDNIRAGKIDILVGTQTLGKGFDLPLLSTLGVLVADSSLQLPDYTAAERTYQLVNQVLGRIQRGHRTGRAIIQTYTPESPLLAAALGDDWQTFYDTELAERKLFGYPPYQYILRVTCRRASARSAESACSRVRAVVLEKFPAVVVDGPAPALHERFKETYTWQLIVKSASRGQLLEIVDALPTTVTSYDIDPINLL